MFKTENCAVRNTLKDLVPAGASVPLPGDVADRTKAVGTVLSDAARAHFGLSRDWTEESVTMVRETFKPRTNPAEYAYAAGDLVMETATKTPAYLTKYARLVWDTNVNVVGALFGRGDVTEAEVETPASVKAKATAKVAKPAAKVQATAEFVDDIELIDGIGPVIAKKLKDHGITTLAQIAALTADEIVRIEDELAFKGRITRDEWVAQAGELMSGQAAQR